MIKCKMKSVTKTKYNNIRIFCAFQTGKATAYQRTDEQNFSKLYVPMLGEKRVSNITFIL